MAIHQVRCASLVAIDRQMVSTGNELVRGRAEHGQDRELVGLHVQIWLRALATDMITMSSCLLHCNLRTDRI